MFPKLTPVVRALILANVVIFGLQLLTGGQGLLVDFALWPWRGAQIYGTPPFEPWQLITYAFLHGGFWHIFGNMFALFIFGPDIEALVGSRRFTLYYFVCVIGAALTQLFVMHSIYPGPYPTIGASGGIFGVLLFYGLAFPHRRLLLL
ncbi:MAG: rhomboid family intramembrane serine protease, partial [Steroidobacteraceae bacterium]